MKAGLLPRLAGACPVGLRRGHRRRHRGPAAQGAAETLSRPAGRPGPDRHHRGPAPRTGLEQGQKVFIVLDQFEQWLHARRGEENTRTGPGPAAVRRRTRPVRRHGARRLLAGREPVHGRPADRAGPGPELPPWSTSSTCSMPAMCWRRSAGPSDAWNETRRKEQEAFLDQAVQGLSRTAGSSRSGWPCSPRW